MQEHGIYNNDCGCYFDIEYSYRENALILALHSEAKVCQGIHRGACFGQPCPFKCSANVGCCLPEKTNFLSNAFERVTERFEVIVVGAVWEIILKVKSFFQSKNWALLRGYWQIPFMFICFYTTATCCTAKKKNHNMKETTYSDLLGSPSCSLDPGFTEWSMLSSTVAFCGSLWCYFSSLASVSERLKLCCANPPESQSLLPWGIFHIVQPNALQSTSQAAQYSCQQIDTYDLGESEAFQFLGHMLIESH